MQRIDGHWVFSASDLVAQLECDHRTRLELARKAGLITPKAASPSAMLQLAITYGIAHENTVLQSLQAEHGPDAVVIIEQPAAGDGRAMEAGTRATREAMDAGVPVIYQGVLYDGEFLGYADFLIRSGTDPQTGVHVYEPYDTKLARTAKPGAKLQLAAYADALGRTGRPTPKQVHVWLGDGTVATFATADLMPELDRVREQVRAYVAVEPSLPSPTWGAAKTACGHCKFEAHCQEGREVDRDLSLVLGMRADWREALRAAGILTIDDLAARAEADRPAGISATSFEKMRAQAALQVRQDATRTEADPVGTVIAEAFAPDGFARLPEPSRGDMFFDMESHPFADDGRSLEYLLGVVTVDSADPKFTAYWGHDRAAEKAAFEGFIDDTMRRLERWPDLHVYHYAHYEPSALKRLAEKHGTRASEVNSLIDAGVLVDLYAVMRESVRVSQRSMSLKKLEPLYLPGQRESGVTNAGDSVVGYDEFRGALPQGDILRAREVLLSIEKYNEIDCLSTLKLRDWLLELGADAGYATGQGRSLPITPVKASASRSRSQRATAAASAGSSHPPKRRTPSPSGPGDGVDQRLEHHRGRAGGGGLERVLPTR